MTTKNPLTEVREHLIAALHADLVGPFLPPAEDGEEAEEVLRLPPSRWYLTGFLAPARGRELEAAAGSDDEELPAGSDEDDEDAAAADPEPKRKNILPASMGLSLLLPPGSADETVRATLSYAEYTAENEADEIGDSYRVWRRHAREPVTVELRLDPAEIAKGRRLDVPKDVWIVGRLETGLCRKAAVGAGAQRGADLQGLNPRVLLRLHSCNDLTSRYSSSPKRPSSRPLPDRL